MAPLMGTATTRPNRSESTNMNAPPTMTPGSSRMFIFPLATSYVPNAKLAIVSRVANEIAPTFEADQAASSVARTIGGASTQIIRRFDGIALHFNVPLDYHGHARFIQYPVPPEAIVRSALGQERRSAASTERPVFH